MVVIHLRLVGLCGADREVTEDPAEMARLLAAEWCPTFTNKTINLQVAAKVISAWTIPMNLEGITLPSPHDFAAAASRERATAPAPDGIPYGAWASSGLVAGRTLPSMELLLRTGLLPPVSFDEAFLVLSPNGGGQSQSRPSAASGDSTSGT